MGGYMLVGLGRDAEGEHFLRLLRINELAGSSSSGM